jgi:HAD domain in Swiss Army Knife RNA repair proteins
MCVIFLDIDGCLNYRDFIYGRTTRHNRSKYRPANKAEIALSKAVPEDEFSDHLWYFRAINGKKVKLLERVFQATQAKVVISSSWRRGASKNYLGLYLRCYGFSGEVIDSTPDDLHLRDEYLKYNGRIERGWEIQEWLKEHPEVSSYIIIDDESDMDGVAHRLVKTSFDVGLTQDHVDLAIQMLSSVST